MAELYVQGFSTYAGFVGGTVASVVTRAEIGMQSRGSKGGVPSDYTRPMVPGEFPGSSQINRNATQLKILNKLEEQYNRTQDSRDVAGQSLKSLRGERANKKTLEEMQAYRSLLSNENNKLLKQGSATVQKQKNDKENAAIADQIAKSKGWGNSLGAKTISQREIDDYKSSNNVGSKGASNKKKIKTKPKVKKGKVAKLKKKR